MKKLIYISLFILGAISFASCTSDEDEIFDDSAANRMKAKLEEYNNILTSAPNGWVMQYYAGEDNAKLGGYNYLCSFKDGEVTIATERYLPSSGEALPKETSLYRLDSDQGPVLSLDTYNSLIHDLADPSSGNPSGNKGDYEFVIYQASAEQIIMKGKKHGLTIVMTPLASATTWESYLESIVTIKEKTFLYTSLTLLLDNKEIGTGNYKDNTYNLKYQKSGQDSISISEYAIYTPTGMRLYQPIYINGTTVQNFTWDDATKTYTCDDATNIKIVCSTDPTYYNYEEYIGSYTFSYTNFSGNSVTIDVTLTPQTVGKTYVMSGFTKFNIVVTYDYYSGTISIPPQLLGADTDGNPINLYPWGGSGGSFWATTISGGYKGTGDGNHTNPNITFKSNGTIPTANGLLIIITASNGYYLYSANGCMKDLVMTKK